MSLANGFEAHLETLETGKQKVDHSTPGINMRERIFRNLNSLTSENYWRIALRDIMPACRIGPLTPASRGFWIVSPNRPIPLPPPHGKLWPPNGSPSPPLSLLQNNRQNDAFQIAFFCRMLFSCLVDADFLATEEFMDRTQAPAA